MKRKVIAGILIALGLAVMSVPLYFKITGSQKSDEMIERFEHMVEQETVTEHEEEKEDCGQEETEATISEEDAATLAKEEVIGLIEIETLDIKYAVMEGTGKSDKIKVDTTIRIPKQMQLEHGDIGVLYGNLLDNAIEACRKVEEDRRFIRIENKFTEGKLLLIVENSKTGERNESLKTTKKDNYSHGRGIHSVRKVVEKYNGTVTFTDKGEIFEVSAMLYGIEAKE